MARLLIEVARRSFRRASSYRLATASGVFINTIFGYLRASVLVYVAASSGGSIRGLSGAELATFAFISQGFIMVVGAFGDTELADRIRSGDIVVDLYRPADLQLWWLASWLGKSGFSVLARGVPPVLLGAIAFDLVWPADLFRWFAFGVSLVLACIAGFALRFLSGLVTFWLLDSRGIDQMVTVLMNFFAGMLLPVTLFPGWLESIARSLPFASMVQLPAEVFLGNHVGLGLVSVLLQQVFWAAVLLLAGRMLLSSATKRVVIQGG